MRFLAEFLAKVGSLTAGSTASMFWIADEPECPVSLIK